MRKLVVLLLVLLLALLATVPTSADPPDRETLHLEFTQLAADCGDFEILADSTIDVARTFFYDRDGTLIRMTAHARGEDHLYHPDNPEHIITGSFSWNREIDHLTGEDLVSGLVWHITLPGHGNVLLDAGRGEFVWIVDDWYYVPLAGHHEFDDALCEALRPAE